MTERRDLLPGISADGCPPVVVTDSRSAIARARQRARVRDVLQVVLLIAVDFVFVHFPHTRVPFLGRSGSFAILALANVAMAVWLWLMRVMPRWRARRIAGTWSVSERDRFDSRTEP